MDQHILVEGTTIKSANFRTNLPFQKPMLRQIEWWVHNGPNTKNGVLTLLHF